MPGIAQKINNIRDDNNKYQVENGTVPFHSFNGSSVPGDHGNGFWSKHRDDVSCNQLQKFWCELPQQARHKLLRIDKQTLFEHARKNMYCSRCNGLLLEGFLQIVMYGKSLQQDTACSHYGVRANSYQNDGNFSVANVCQDDTQDPSVHPWGGLTTARDGTLTLLDCYLYSKSLKGIQNVFDSARARERERELLYPDACGGGGRGWISQGMAAYGRGHGTRETCALHTARLSVETLVDFWSALGEETRQSLLKMKEEDFIERLMFRFDSKRFCRDCRRNVIREFKELKELKRIRKEPRCTSWFCVADTAFQYEVSQDTVQADWHQTFLDAFGTYHHFEWAIGSGEGKSDILEFENVGLSGRVQVNGLDLSDLNACYITLRAWKMDGRCNELCVKAHALRGQKCVHCRLVVGDGFVTITRGDSIRKFFEHAEEAEEEEDDDSMDKDGNELDGECSRPQKHAKSPELAREFLLDAATVIFKEQVEKAFREGTARQNAHSIFVCLALKLLEERLHVACKEIITLEKQMKLLEEEEKEKREEEERKERRRTKEREKKLRRKERLREKEIREKKFVESNQDPVVTDVTRQDTTPCVDEGANIVSNRDSVSDAGEDASPLSPDIQDDELLNEYINSKLENHPEDSPNGEFGSIRDWNTTFPYDHFKYSRRKLKLRNDLQQDLNLKWFDKRRGAVASENGIVVSKYESRYHADGFESSRSTNGFNKQLRTSAAKSNIRNSGPKLSEKFQCPNNRLGDKYGSHACSCNHHNEHRSRQELSEVVREHKYANKLQIPSDMSKPYYRGSKYTQIPSVHETNGRLKSKIIASNLSNTKKVWEPLDSQKYVRSSSDSDVTLRSTDKVEASGSDQLPESSVAKISDEATSISVQTNYEDNDLRDLTRCGTEYCRDTQNEFHMITKSQQYSKEAVVENGKLCSITRSAHEALDSSMSRSSNSDNCSSCLSEGDSNTSSSNPQNLESTSTSDSEEASQNSEERESSYCLGNGFSECARVVMDQSKEKDQGAKSHGPDAAKTNFSSSLSTEPASLCDKGRDGRNTCAQSLGVLQQPHNQSVHYPVFPTPSVSYYHQSPVAWPAGSTNGLMPFPHANHYLYASTFGYGLNGNARFMQYGALHHVSTPLLNPAHLPIFQTVAQINGANINEHKAPSLGGLKEMQHSVQKVAPIGHPPPETPTEKSETRDARNNGFSLFHFGGPVALSTEFQANPVSLEGEVLEDTSLNLSANSPDGNQACNKKDAIEEYNLFAASNGIKFSFF